MILQSLFNTCYKTVGVSSHFLFHHHIHCCDAETIRYLFQPLLLEPNLFLPTARYFDHRHYSHKENYTYPDGSKTHDKTDANSFLVGAGIAEGRQRGSNTFYYISLLFDVIKNPNSPYVNNVYDQNTGQLVRTDLVPIIRAGINIGLF